MEYYATSLAHILAELGRLDLFIRAQVWRARQLHKGEQDGLAPFYIGETEVETLLQKAVGSPVWAEVPLPAELQSDLQTALDRMAAEVEQRVAASLSRGIDLRLISLAQTFGLSAFDTDAILIALAPELDRRYERLYAYLHDDVTRKHATVDLVLNLLCPQLDARIVARARFAPTAPLQHHALVQLFEDPGFRQASLLGKHVQLDPRIADYLLGGDEIDSRLQPYAQRIEPQVDLDQLIGLADLKTRLPQMTAPPVADKESPVLYFQGPYGVGKQAMAKVLCKQVDMGLLSVNTRRLVGVKIEEFETLVRLAHREARLQGAAVYWDGVDCLLDDDQQTRREDFVQALAAHPGLIFLGGDKAWEPSRLHHTRKFLRVEFPQPTYDQRLQLWTTALPEQGVALEAVAAKFRFSGGRIRDAAATARSLAHWRDPATSRVNDADLYAACRLQSNRRLSTLAQAITPHYGWDDIVL
ncbi:MAG TPA: AAA family ATPase, partial [Methylococcaceae bacterium]|nr:AAA family ATPase [Methylococcaceae bacterium]